MQIQQHDVNGNDDFRPYYNNPMEYNAHSEEIINELLKIIDNLFSNKDKKTISNINKELKQDLEKAFCDLKNGERSNTFLDKWSNFIKSLYDSTPESAANLNKKISKKIPNRYVRLLKRLKNIIDEKTNQKLENF